MQMRWNPFRHRGHSGVESDAVDALRTDRPASDPQAPPVGSACADTGLRTRIATGWDWPNKDGKLPGDRRKVLIVVPVFTHVFPEAFEHFMRLMIVGSTYCPFDFEMFVPARQLLHGAMNQAVDVVRENDFDAMIVFDDDCLPYLWKYDARALGRPDPRRFQVIPRLLGLMEEKRADVIAGVGYMRNYPHTTTVGRLYKEGMTAIRSQHSFSGFYWVDDLSKHEHEIDKDGLLPVDFCGMPVMLIPRYVLDGIKLPAFGTVDDEGGACTHDVYFCKKVREAGFTIRVDTMIDSGHIMPAPIVDRFTRPLARHGVQADDRGTDPAPRSADTDRDAESARSTPVATPEGESLCVA